MTGEPIKARVTVTGRIDNGDGQPDMIRSEHAAVYSALETGFVLEYDEEQPRAHVRLTVFDGCALMERSGDMHSRMEFLPGQMRDAEYVLPEGEFDMQTQCLTLSHEAGPTRGTLRVAYRLLSGGQTLSDNLLMVIYKLC